ncbi:MAG: FprA family A-type flavoprotein [Candidatus Ratteibacteria bacterium]|nr:FprA family A-type flavoprotein [Candidatus Ratteibacteria bacterium]
MVREIKKDVYGIIINDWDRRLFDELIPLPDGTTYNAYLIKDRKNVLIDTSDPRKTDKFISILKKISEGRIDYVVSNHSEQDHAGGIPAVLNAFPEAKVITGEKGAILLNKLLLIPDESIIKVKNEEEINIGSRTLKFFYTPWVHWPETIITYSGQDRVLFTCDLFGSHLSTSSFYSTDNRKVYDAAKRYYAEIMMPFRSHIKKHLDLLAGLEFDIVAPSHGPIHNSPDFIINAYKDWVSDSVKNEVVIPYVSMHGSVEKMVDYFIDELTKRDITVKPFNLTVTDIGELAGALVDAATVVLGTPAVLGGPHPSAVYATYLFKVLRPKTRNISVIGSFGWGSNMLKVITEMLPKDIEIIEPVIVNGYPQKDDFIALTKLADDIVNKHKELQ